MPGGNPFRGPRPGAGSGTWTNPQPWGGGTLAPKRPYSAPPGTPPGLGVGNTQPGSQPGTNTPNPQPPANTSGYANTFGTMAFANAVPKFGQYPNPPGPLGPVFGINVLPLGGSSYVKLFDAVLIVVAVFAFFFGPIGLLIGILLLIVALLSIATGLFGTTW